MFIYSPLEQFEMYRTILPDLDSLRMFYSNIHIETASEKFFNFFDSLTEEEQLFCIDMETKLAENYGEIYKTMLIEEITSTGQVTVLELDLLQYMIEQEQENDKEFYHDLDFFLENLSETELNKLSKISNMQDLSINFEVNKVIENMTEAELISLMNETQFIKQKTRLNKQELEAFNNMTEVEILDLLEYFRKDKDGLLSTYCNILYFMSEEELVTSIKSIDLIFNMLSDYIKNENFYNIENFHFFKELCDIYLYGENIAFIDLFIEQFPEKEFVELSATSLALFCINTGFF